MRPTGLTGRFDLRRTWTGNIVLQVEEEVRRRWPLSRRSPTRRRWRDATLLDLAQPELRPLMDLRHKPVYGWEHKYGPLCGGDNASPASAIAPDQQDRTRAQPRSIAHAA